MFMFPSLVCATSKTSCDYTLTANLKKLASNINITYKYRIIDDEVYFDITLANIQSNLYFIDSKTKNTYYYSDTNNGVITINDYKSGSVSFSVYSNDDECLDEKLVVKKVKLPFYNKYYKLDECLDNNSFVCNKWTDNYVNYNTFLDYTKKSSGSSLNYEVVETNNDSINRFIEFIISYYYIILPILIIVIVGVLYLIRFIKYRKNRFDI